MCGEGGESVTAVFSFRFPVFRLPGKRERGLEGSLRKYKALTAVSGSSRGDRSLAGNLPAKELQRGEPILKGRAGVINGPLTSRLVVSTCADARICCGEGESCCGADNFFVKGWKERERGVCSQLVARAGGGFCNI